MAAFEHVRRMLPAFISGWERRSASVVRGSSSKTSAHNGVQVVPSAGQALRIDNQFRVVLGLRRTTLSDVHAVQPWPPHHRPGRYRWTPLSRAGLHLSAMSLHPLAAEFIAPCLPTKTDKLPSSSQSLHEIKHDGSASLRARTARRVTLEAPHAWRCHPTR